MYQTGCLEMLAKLLGDNVVAVILTCVSVMVIQVRCHVKSLIVIKIILKILGVCFSCCLARSVQVQHWEY